MILKHLMPPKLILKKPSPTSFSLEIPINLLGFEDGSKKNKTKRHFKFTENGFFLHQAKLPAEGCCIYDDLQATKNILLMMRHLRLFHISMILTQDQDTLG